MQLVSNLNGIDWATTVLGQNDISLASALVFLILRVWTVQEHNHISVLLEGTGFTEVGQLWALICAGFRTTVQLGDRDEWDIELLCQQFQLSGELRDFLLTRFNFLT